MTPVPLLAMAGVAVCSVLAAVIPDGDGETAKLISGGSAGLQALALWTLWNLRRDVDELRQRMNGLSCLGPARQKGHASAKHPPCA